MKINDIIRYRNYEIVRTSKVDYCTVIAHDTLRDAKAFIDRLIAIDELVGEEEWKVGITK